MASGLWVGITNQYYSIFTDCYIVFSYWYQNTCLFPDLASVFIAIDKTDVENGCLKVMKSFFTKLNVNVCMCVCRY